MSRPKSPLPPAYRLHKASGRAVVTIDERDHYLGKHGSPESRAAYDAIVAKWLNNGRKLPDPPRSPDTVPTGITVVELLDQYLAFAETYYSGSDEYANMIDAVAPVHSRLQWR